MTRRAPALPAALLWLVVLRGPTLLLAALGAGVAAVALRLAAGRGRRRSARSRAG